MSADLSCGGGVERGGVVAGDELVAAPADRVRAYWQRYIQRTPGEYTGAATATRIEVYVRVAPAGAVVLKVVPDRVRVVIVGGVVADTG